MNFFSAQQSHSVPRRIKKPSTHPNFLSLKIANCTETVQSELSLCWPSDSSSQPILFHTVFNRTVENFYIALTFLSHFQPDWLSNCLCKKNNFRTVTRVLRRAKLPHKTFVQLRLQLALSFAAS